MINNESKSESNFYNFINLIFDRKGTIFFFILILTTLSVIVSLILPKTYRASATFEMGYFHTGTQTYISDSKIVQEKLRSILIPEGGYGPIKDIRIPINRAPGILSIVSEEGSVEEAVSAIEDAFDLFVQMNNDFIEAIAKSNTVEQQIKAIVYDQFNRREQETSEKIDETIFRLTSQLPSGEKIKPDLFEQTRIRELITKETLDNIIMDAILRLNTQLGIKISSIKSVDSNAKDPENSGFIAPRIVGKINVVPYPISPNKTSIVVLTFIASIFLSVMYVLLTNFLASMKK